MLRGLRGQTVRVHDREDEEIIAVEEAGDERVLGLVAGDDLQSEVFNNLV